MLAIGSRSSRLPRIPWFLLVSEAPLDFVKVCNGLARAAAPAALPHRLWRVDVVEVQQPSEGNHVDCEQHLQPVTIVRRLDGAEGLTFLKDVESCCFLSDTAPARHPSVVDRELEV